MNRNEHIISGGIRFVFTAICAVVMSMGCTGNFSDINSAGGPNEDQATGDFFNIGVHLQSLQTNVIVLSSVNAYQFNESLSGHPYARYMTITKDAWNTNNFCVFNPTTDWQNAVFQDQITRVYSSWFDLRSELEEQDMMEHYSWAWAELLRVAAVHRTTDMYGPLPYSQIKTGDGSIYVAYDTQQQVYDGMFEDLNAAIEILTGYVQSGGASEYSALKTYDLVYSGDFTKWVKFANSLKLRMAMRISLVDPAKAETYAKQALEHPIGVISSNQENAFVTYGTNPLWIMQGSYGDTRAAADLMTHLKGYNDPRLERYFVPAAESGEYRAMRVGISIPSENWAQTNFSIPRVGELDPTLWMCAAEVAFLKAEAALNGWIADDPGTLYNEGITLSFEQWGASGVDVYIDDETSVQTSYSDDSANSASAVSTITIKWDAAASDEVKRERLATQKWIALFPLGHEAWAEHRRTGYPRFFTTPVVNNTDSSLAMRGASRLPYPPSELQDNTVNVQDAINNKGLGGNNGFGARLWWDVKTGKPGW